MNCPEHADGCPVAGPGRAFYVTVRDGRRRAVLAGPYPTHVDALARVDDARRLADAADRFSAFYDFGTMQGPDHLAAKFGQLPVPA